MPKEKFKFELFEIKSFNYRQATGKERTKTIRTHVTAQLGRPKNKANSNHRLQLNVLLCNSENEKDNLLLEVKAVAYFVCPPEIEEEAVEEYVKNEVFPLAYAELAERVKRINENLGIEYIVLPAYDNSED